MDILIQVWFGCCEYTSIYYLQKSSYCVNKEYCINDPRILYIDEFKYLQLLYIFAANITQPS